MNLNLLSLDIVKSQLGLLDATYDSQITAMIPIVSSDVRRILNTQYDDYVPAKYNSGSATLNVFNPAQSQYIKSYFKPVHIPLGTVISGSGIPDDTYIVSMSPDTGVFTMSAEATGSGDYVYPTINIAMWPTISKMIWFKISGSTITDASKQNVQSKRIGPTSVTYAASEINKQWNYPQRLIDDLGVPFQEVG